MAEKKGGAWHEHGHGVRMRPGKGRPQRRLSVLAQGSGKRAEVTGGTRPRGLPFSPWTLLSKVDGGPVAVT